jgi:L-threonylcarbamoyladenylate synthase
VRPDPIGDAILHVGAGGLLAYPTETVWGCGADSTSEVGVERLRAWKGRGDAAPISILVAGLAELEGLDFEVGDAAMKLAGAFWPGPLTLVMPCRGKFANGIGRADGAIGVRCSAHPLAAAIARRAEAVGVGPLTATSLNRSGAPAAASRADADDCARSAPELLRVIEVEGAESGGDAASTVVDVCAEEPEVLRWGSIPAAEIEPLLEEIRTP